MDQHRISTDGKPELEPKTGKGFQFEKQKPKIAGISKRNENLGNLQSTGKSLVQNSKISITDSDHRI